MVPIWQEHDYLYNLKKCLYKIITKRGIAPLQGRKLAVTTLNQVLKGTTTGNGINQSRTPPPEDAMRTQSRFCDTAAKNGQPKSNSEETSDDPKVRDVLQSNWHVIFKSIEVIKVKTVKPFRSEGDQKRPDKQMQCKAQ